MIVGYARVSTVDQTTTAQIPALKKAKCKRIYEEMVSGQNMERPQLEQCLDRLEVRRHACSLEARQTGPVSP